jgi:diguanylate cyclase (GGDEF)-like protein
MSIGRPLITPPKISTRLTSASLVSLVSALVLAIGTLCAVAFFTLRTALVEDSHVQAKILADNVAAAMLFQDRKAAYETLRTMRTSPILNRAAVLLPSGERFVHFDAQGEADAPFHIVATPRFHRYNLELSVPINYEGKAIGHVYLDYTLAGLYRQTLVYGLYALAIGGTALLLAGLRVARAQKAVAAVEQDLLRMAHVDEVTKLWNRNTFNQHLAAALRQAQQQKQTLAVILLDLDNFKSINDSLGHHHGDVLLGLASSRLINLLGDKHIICRLGGDEFAMVLQHVDASALSLIAQSIIRLIAKPFTVDGDMLSITCSLGVSVYPDDAADSAALVRHADSAMYQAKLAGRNNYQIFTRDMQARLQRRKALETGLRNAIDANELELHFQPLYATDDGQLQGAEALLRWHNAELGQVSPAEFIPIAEESNLILTIGDWVLRRACEHLREWQSQGLSLPHLSINMSPRQLRRAQLAQNIIDTIVASGADPHRIGIELTESTMMETTDTLIGELTQLQQCGVEISIDDFGTGYSSMAYLKRLPLNRIKIDRAFIQDLPHNDNDREIVAAMIAMSHNLGFQVTAEGVETTEQLEFLRQLGCNTVQGYLLGRPLHSNAFAQLLREYA